MHKTEIDTPQTNIFSKPLFDCLDNADSICKIFNFMHLAEKLKMHLRYGKTSDGNNETVAAHSWRLALLVILSYPHLKKPFDLEKGMMMAIIHDLVEIEVGDIHFLDLENKTMAKEIYQKELKAISTIRDFLGNSIGDKIYEYWIDFENQISYEAQVVKALDKIEGYIQQNDAPLSTWTKEETDSVFYYLDQYCDFDPLLKRMKELIIKEAKEKLEVW